MNATRHHMPARDHESGVVLILLMLVVVLVGAASLSIASTSRDTFAATRGDAAQAAAQAALDGALATARHRLRTDPAWRGSIERIDGHRIESAVEPLGDGYRVTLTARSVASGGHSVAAIAILGAPQVPEGPNPVVDHRPASVSSGVR